MRIDVRPNDEADEVEERHPQLVGQEGLREGERERDVTQLTFITGMKPARTVARIWWKVRAPAMTAMEVR